MAKYGETPDHFIPKGGKAGELARDIMDMEYDYKSGGKRFTRDDFLSIITDTYNEFYGKFRDQFNPDEYLQCVDDERLVERFGAFLE